MNTRTLITFALGALVGALVGASGDLAPTAEAAGSQLTWNLTAQTRKDFFANTQGMSERIARQAANERAFIAVSAVAARAEAERIGAKWRLEVEASFPSDSWDDNLPAIIYDIAYGYVDADPDGAGPLEPDGIFDPAVDTDLQKLWLNAAAETKRATPPAGFVVGWGP